MAEYNTFHYILALLKKYGIKHIVACPGTQNSSFNLAAQEDHFFECFSVVDERSAAYTAIGIQNVTNEPVALTCTGATAARNFLSAMTEAFYSGHRLLVLTAYNPRSSKFNMAPQFTDRSLSQNDIKIFSVSLPEIKDSVDRTFVITAINAALSQCKYRKGPVHINFPSSFNFAVSGLPEHLWKTDYQYDDFSNLQKILFNHRVAVFIGYHKKFTTATERVISEFAKTFHAPVICDNCSNYSGLNKVLISKYRYFSGNLSPDIVIDLGGISGIYGQGKLWSNLKELWRISSEACYQARYDKKLTRLLVGEEKISLNY